VLVVIRAVIRSFDQLRSDDVANVVVEDRRFARRGDVVLDVGAFVEAGLHRFLHDEAFVDVVVQKSRFAAGFSYCERICEPTRATSDRASSR